MLSSFRSASLSLCCSRIMSRWLLQCRSVLDSERDRDGRVTPAGGDTSRSVKLRLRKCDSRVTPVGGDISLSVTLWLRECDSRPTPAGGDTSPPSPSMWLSDCWRVELAWCSADVWSLACINIWSLWILISKASVTLRIDTYCFYGMLRYVAVSYVILRYVRV